MQVSDVQVLKFSVLSFAPLSVHSASGQGEFRARVTHTEKTQQIAVHYSEIWYAS